MPQAIDRYHDLRGVGGLSPYEIVFGRYRPLGNIPYTPERDCEDAQQFFKRMREIDEGVCTVLNELHDKRAAQVNKRRAGADIFCPGDLVWYRRPERSGHKLDSRWLGKAVVLGREGESSYLIQTKPDGELKAHTSFLKKMGGG